MSKENGHMPALPAGPPTLAQFTVRVTQGASPGELQYNLDCSASMIANWPLMYEICDKVKEIVKTQHTKMLMAQASGIVAAPADALNEINRMLH